jgi:hypothetical protein
MLILPRNSDRTISGKIIEQAGQDPIKVSDPDIERVFPDDTSKKIIEEKQNRQRL